MTQLDLIILWIGLIFAVKIGQALAMSKMPFWQVLAICGSFKLVELAFTG